jgi:hypothetical protein
MIFAHDAMHTNLCLQFDPKDIATTAVYLAGQYNNAHQTIRPVVGDNRATDWLEVLGQSVQDVDTLTSIAIPLIDAIVANRKTQSNDDEEKAVFAKIKNNVAALLLLRNESNKMTGTSEETLSDPLWKRRRT